MSDSLRRGDRVEWNSHGGKKSAKGKARGEVVEKITSARTIKGHTAKATEEEPQFVVRSDNGGEAAHKPDALHRES